MNAAVPIEALTALRRVDPARDALTTALCRRLAAVVDGVQVTCGQGDDSPWFLCTQGVAFRPAHGAPLSDTRIVEASAVLDALDPLLAAIEEALEIDLEPEAIGALPDAAALCLRLDGATPVLLAVPLDHPKAEDWGSTATTPHIGAVPIPVTCDLTGPRLAVSEAADLARGDLVLLDASPIARLSTMHGPAIDGQLDLAAARFTVTVQGASMADATPAADFAVPLSIRLPERAVAAATLGELRPGMTLPLGPLTEGMPVTLLVTGRVFAQGELVQLGDRFAVLIESLADADDGAVADESLEEDAA